MTGYGSVVVYCDESDKAATEAALKTAGHSWTCHKRHGGGLAYTIPVSIDIQKSTVRAS